MSTVTEYPTLAKYLQEEPGLRLVITTDSDGTFIGYLTDQPENPEGRWDYTPTGTCPESILHAVDETLTWEDTRDLDVPVERVPPR